ncbi:high light inducible protein [Prochlorococcus sp. MIT 1307]|uniref:high light inducible protein n=1 Tax=Prochlorococcus sp. MIT 1307 TaxID=3096219 RepID=UPI002A758190|nr:high light inducible protein [Prochlorococcus sp. MIT 1307]
MDSHQNHQAIEVDHPVSRVELNSWRRGFTPQAEIWNGRMAWFGLLVGLSLLVSMNFLIN